MGDTYVVRYGQMRLLGEFRGQPDQMFARGARVVVQTDRGTELAEVLCPADERSTRFLEQAQPGAILRGVTAEDLAAHEQLADHQKDGFATCRRFIADRRLQMELVDVEAILGRERMVFYYLAEKRVDFRELVKDLARVYHTRIEMRQIGVRDEAKLLADYGDCGKPVCCNTHLSRMPPVTMRMAKVQKTTLDPSKISGRCGRLKCCLRYEFDNYQEFERSLPRAGSRVDTDRGPGKVLALELLAQRMLLELDDGRRIIAAAGDIRSVGPGGPATQHPDEADNHGE